jgi:tetratricopeptide (TPR) repeat protein
MFALAGLAIAVALLWPPYRRLLDTSLAIRPVGVNLMTQARALSYLATQLLRPWAMNADPALPATTHLDAPTALLGLAWIGAALTGLALLRRQPAVAFGLLWFLLWLLPTNSLLPRYDVANDRQLYLALIGPAWLFGLTVAAASRRLALRWLPAPAAAAIGVLLAVATLQRNHAYADEIRFWQDVVHKSSLSPRAANNLGMAYAFACRDAEALREFERAVRLQPGYIRARINLRLLRAGALFPDPAARGPVRADLGIRHCDALGP